MQPSGGSSVRCRPWSEFELALLDGLYPQRGPWRAELRKALALAGRKPGAIRQVAHLRDLAAAEDAPLAKFERLARRNMSIARASAVAGVPLRVAFDHPLAAARRNAAAWTPQQDDALREHWGWITPARLTGMFPEHTWLAITTRARRLKLGKSYPRGWVPADVFTRRYKLTRRTVKRVLHAARVPCAHPYRRDRPAISVTRYYSPALADYAMRQHFRGETIAAAAARHGTAYATMQRAAVAYGLIKPGPVPRPTLVERSEIDAAIAAYWAARPVRVRMRVRRKKAA